MPPLEAHPKTSRKKTGNKHREIHEWLDRDPETAAERHDITKIYEYGKWIEEQHGSEALDQYIDHIRDDMRSKFKGIRDNHEQKISEALAYFGCV